MYYYGTVEFTDIFLTSSIKEHGIVNFFNFLHDKNALHLLYFLILPGRNSEKGYFS